MARKDKHFHYSRYGTDYKSYKVISAYGRNEVKVTQELYEERFILVGLVTKLTVFSSLLFVVCVCVCVYALYKCVYIHVCVWMWMFLCISLWRPHVNTGCLSE